MSGGGLIRAKIVNVSIGGFYCLSAERFLPGEMIQCVLSLSPCVAPSGNSYLCGQVRVVRVEQPDCDETLFGVACEIQSYEIRSR
jgi:hypothetical protein